MLIAFNMPQTNVSITEYDHHYVFIRSKTDVSVKRIRHYISSPPYGIYSSIVIKFIK